MHYYEVAPNKVIRAGSDSFTYSFNKRLAVGQIVQIEIGKTSSVGVIVRKVPKPPYPTKNITTVIETKALPKQLIDLASWMSEYYKTPLALVLQTMLPRGLTVKRRAQDAREHFKRRRTKIVFNKEQRQVLDQITDYDDGTFLLHGVTGSGKTEIYIELAKQALMNGRSAIILVPEIALTSQLIAELSNHFDDLLVTHSRMSDSSRHLIWQDSLNSQTPRVAIGPRSALFLPLSDVGLIVVDEAHEPSYKQEQSPKYSALRVATMLGRYHGARVLFGTATPAITDMYLAEESNRPILRLTKPAIENTKPPLIETIDSTDKARFASHRFISDKLLNAIDETLENGNQVLIFHNRRGSTSTSICSKCGWLASCPNCHLPLSLHSDQHSLTCHICGYSTNVPTVCPNCSSTDIIHKGIGTKLIETELTKLFPKANIARFDADNSKDDSIEKRYDELYKGEIDIAIGTQIVAKGLDLPHLRTVGIIQADTGLAIPDFNSDERTFQLLYQVIGRVGRNDNQTKVIVQTYQPNHTIVNLGVNRDYESFYRQALLSRKRSNFPPYSYLLKLTCSYKTETAAIRNSKELAKILRENYGEKIQILGPTPAFYERKNGNYRWQLILKSPKREYLVDSLQYLQPKYWQFDLDPSSLL